MCLSSYFPAFVGGVLCMIGPSLLIYLDKNPMSKKLAVILIGLAMSLFLIGCAQTPAVTSSKQAPAITPVSTKNTVSQTTEPQPSTTVTEPAVSNIPQYYIRFKLDGEEKTMTRNFTASFDPYPERKGFTGLYTTMISGNDDGNGMASIFFPGKVIGEYSTKTNYQIGDANYAPGLFWNIQGVTYQNDSDNKDSAKIVITQYDANGVKGTFEGILNKVGPTGYIKGDIHTISNGEIFVPFGDISGGVKQSI
jgi:hypothetical protein